VLFVFSFRQQPQAAGIHLLGQPHMADALTISICGHRDQFLGTWE
jgi:hypothetical protein